MYDGEFGTEYDKHPNMKEYLVKQI